MNANETNTNFKVTMLGTGTSTGVPTIGCKCGTCLSDDLRDKRLRTSIMLESGSTRVVVDSTPDFRAQLLKYNVDSLDAIVYTHHHFDHIGGFDDIRALNFSTRKAVDIYLQENTLSNLKRVFPYAFGKTEQIGGGVPFINEHLIRDEEFRIGDLTFLPIPMMHGILSVLGFRIGNFAYCTDTNFIPDSSFELLDGVEFLIIDALRYHSHPTHFTVDEALKAIERINPKKAWLTHIAHQIKHSEGEEYLPEGVGIAFDGMVIDI